jgi:hypothetical protein
VGKHNAYTIYRPWIFSNKRVFVFPTINPKTYHIEGKGAEVILDFRETINNTAQYGVGKHLNTYAYIAGGCDALEGFTEYDWDEDMLAPDQDLKTPISISIASI